MQELLIAFTSTFPQTKVAQDIRTAIEAFARTLDSVGVYIEQTLPVVDLEEQVHPCGELFGLMATALQPGSNSSPGGMCCSVL